MKDAPAEPRFRDYDWVVVVPAGLQTKEHLLQVLADRLGFPDHFGHNWDALADCLADLSWFPDGRIELVHEDLPLAEDRAEATKYVDVLLDVQEGFAEEAELGDHEERRTAMGARLSVVFPAKLRDEVAALDRLP